MGFGYVDPVTKEPVITDSLLQGGIVSVYYLGTLCGCLLGGWVGDKVGRIKTIAFGAVWAIFGACLQTSAMNATWMICSRFINGIGTGILNAIVPVWATETAEHTSRGQFIAIEFTLNIFGVVVAYWLSFGLSFIDNGESAIRWRFPIAFQIIPLLVLLSAIWFFPESPRWLAKVDRDEEALFILQRLRGTEGDRAEAEYNDIKNVVALEVRESTQNSYLHMLFGIGSGELHTGRRVQLVIWLQIMQEWVGIAGVTVYAPTIFRIAGFDTEKSQWISGLNNIFYMFATLVCVFTLDKIGRRWTLYWGAVGQGISMFLAAAFSRLGIDARAAGNSGQADSYGAAAAAFVFIFTSVFGATWLTVPWLYPAEIFPLQVRAKGNAWGVVGWSIGNGWLTLLCPVMFEAIGENTLHIFGACNVLAIPIIWALYPESNQRTLEEMDLLFAAPTPWVWDAEKTFARLQAERPELVAAAKHNQKIVDVEGVESEPVKPTLTKMRFQTTFALIALAGLTAATAVQPRQDISVDDAELTRKCKAAADTLDKEVKTPGTLEKIFKADVCELIKLEKNLDPKKLENEAAKYKKDLETWAAQSDENMETLTEATVCLVTALAVLGAAGEVLKQEGVDVEKVLEEVLMEEAKKCKDSPSANGTASPTNPSTATTSPARGAGAHSGVPLGLGAVASAVLGNVFEISDWNKMPLLMESMERPCRLCAGVAPWLARNTAKSTPGHDVKISSPCEFLDLPQYWMEPLLVRYATHHGVEMRFKTELVSIEREENSGAIICTLRDLTTQHMYLVQTKYLFGADGARSMVARSPEANFSFDCKPSKGVACNILLKADLSHVMNVDERFGGLNWLMQPDLKARFGIAPALRMVRPWHTWLMVAFAPGEKTDPFQGLTPTSPHLLEFLRLSIGDPDVDIEVLKVDPWKIRESVALNYGCGSKKQGDDGHDIFLLGDAAHRHPPSYGMGSNTGIQDAYNLGWKAAFVGRGLAGPSLLKTYSAERQPVGADLVRISNEGMVSHFAVWQQLGMMAPTAEDGLRQVQELSEASAAGAERRAKLHEAFENMRSECESLGLNMNQWYQSGAIYLEDETEGRPEFKGDPVVDIQISTYPGSRLPHAWLKIPRRGTELSTQDLAGGGSFCLLTGHGGDGWREAADAIAKETGIPIKTFSIGFGLDYHDVDRQWTMRREVGEDGCVLVRPDRFVAWRATRAAADCKAKLGAVLDRILSREELQRCVNGEEMMRA
ncbi:hypothetical protein PspLS_10690 [Pyricularia sp. CBS 133598]|nr:hypothetical protein PspLS_10690 [Pyricularia sp. CBS 133598]